MPWTPARQVTALEDRVRLDRTGRDDDPTRVHLQQFVGCGNRHQATLVDADGHRALEYLHPVIRAHLRAERFDAVAGGARGDLLADRVFVA